MILAATYVASARSEEAAVSAEQDKLAVEAADTAETRNQSPPQLHKTSRKPTDYAGRKARSSMELSMMSIRLQHNSTARAELKQFQRRNCAESNIGLDRIVAEMT
jgi:phage/plasmid primase-like uncharacterized protein